MKFFFQFNLFDPLRFLGDEEIVHSSADCERGTGRLGWEGGTFVCGLWERNGKVGLGRRNRTSWWHAQSTEHRASDATQHHFLFCCWLPGPLLPSSSACSLSLLDDRITLEQKPSVVVWIAVIAGIMTLRKLNSSHASEANELIANSKT